MITKVIESPTAWAETAEFKAVGKAGYALDLAIEDYLSLEHDVEDDTQDTEEALERLGAQLAEAVDGEDRLLRFEMKKRPMDQIEKDSLDKRTRQVSEVKLEANMDAADRQVWRNLLDYLRCLFTMVTHGQLTFEEAFLHAFEVPGRDMTLGQCLVPQFKRAIAGRKVDLLALPDGESK